MPEKSAPNPNVIIPFSEHPQLGNLVPEYVADAVGLDTRRLNRLSIAGCFDPDVQFKVYDGESSTYDTQIVGNIGNTALGGAAGVKQAERGQNELQYGTTKEHSYHTVMPPKMVVSVNSNAVRERAQAAGPARDNKVWATHVNSMITEQIVKASWQNLVKKPPLVDIFTDGVVSFVGANGVASDYLYYSGTAREIAIGQIVSVVLFGANGLRLMIRRAAESALSVPHDLKRIPFSLAPIVKVDRALLVSGLAHTLPVVRPIKSKE